MSNFQSCVSPLFILSIDVEVSSGNRQIIIEINENQTKVRPKKFQNIHSNMNTHKWYIASEGNLKRT